MGTHSESRQGSDVLRELPGYRIVRQLGRGSMGVVYLAEDIALRRNVALKVLAPAVVDGELFRERFDRESYNAATLDHPNIIPIYAAGHTAGALYIAMRYVTGGDLRALLETNGPLHLTQASAVITAMADALDAAHAHGIIHRDVKPANILIDNRNGQEHYYLSDFGIAKIASTAGSLTSTGQVLGTIDYIAPEQVQGKPVDGRADLYALGCVLYRCLTGTVPFPREDIAAHMWAHVHETPPPVTTRRPDLPPHIDHILATAMAKQPEDRYPTCRELAQTLHALAATPATSGQVFPTNPTPPPVSASTTSTYAALTPPIARAPVTTTPQRRQWWQLAAGAVLTLALIAGSTIAILKYLNTRYPNTAEQALLEQLPYSLENSCQRTADPGRDTANVQTSITCMTSGDLSKVVLTRFTSPQALQDRYQSDVAAAKSAKLAPNSGDCRKTDSVEGLYTSELGQKSGQVLCYHQRGASFIEWTDNNAQILGLAMWHDVDPENLRKWWADVVDLKPRTPELTQAPPAASLSPSPPAPVVAPPLSLGIAPARPAPEMTAVKPPAKVQEAEKQPAQTSAPSATPSNPPNTTSTTASNQTRAPSTRSAQSAELDSLEGAAPDSPGPQPNGQSADGTGGCTPPVSRYYYRCTVTRDAPVYLPSRTDKFGTLPAGRSPWFRCQSEGSTYTVGSHTNHWWAWAQDSDVGVWVPILFLAGSHDDKQEPGLPICGSSPTTTTASPTTANSQPPSTTNSQPTGP
jgi:hypothetical protein